MTKATNSLISTCLFDLDGTLADSLMLIEKTYHKVFDDLGIPWNGGRVMEWIGRPLKDIALFFADERAELFITLYQEYYHSWHDLYTGLFPGTRAMLKVLKAKGIKTGIVTSKGRPGTIRTLEFTGISVYLDAVVTAYDVANHKPHPEPVIKALELLGAKPGQAVFVGDSPFDMESGINAGVKIVGVNWGMCASEVLQKYNPLAVLKDWEELHSYLGFD